MIRQYTLPFAIAALLAVLPLTAGAAEITGKVVNGTTNTAVSGIPVSLLQHSAGNVVRANDTTDVEGRYSITIDEEPSGDVPIMLSAIYKDVTYAPGTPIVPGAPADIAVYELTESDTAIVLVSHHIILDTATGQGHHIYIFENRGNHTFRTGGDHGHGIEVRLPEGVTEFGGGPPGVHNHDQTVVDPRPVPPGRLQLSYSFALPVDGRFVQTVSHQTDALDILVTPAEAEVTPQSGLEDLGHVDIGDRHFRRLVGQNLAAGQQIALTVSGGTTPAVSRTATDAGEDTVQDKLPWILGAGAVIFALLALFWRSPSRQGGRTVEASGPETRRAALLEQIADLDDRLESGSLTPEQHQTRREALKAEVVDLTHDIERGA